MVFVMFEKNNPGFNNTRLPQDNSGQLLPSEENIAVYDLTGKKVFSLYPSDDIPTAYLNKLKQNKEIKFSWNQDDYVGIRYVSSKGKPWLIFARGAFSSVEAFNLSRIMIITFFVFILILYLAGYYFSKKVLMPVNEAMNEMDRIHPADLSKRLTTGKNKDEIQRLTITFNRLLDRIEEAFRIQKGFLSNISHEVRNPIGSMIAAIQLSLSRERTPEEYQQTLRLALQDAVELQHISFQLMELARLSDSSNQPKLRTVRIDEIVWQAKAAVRKVHPDFHFLFDDSRFPSEEKYLTILGNEALLKVAMTNLFENACKFSTDHTAQLSIFLTQDHLICIQITDRAETLTEVEKHRIFIPFFRSSNAIDVQGSGIGLSLVQSILHLHKATLSIEPNNPKGNIFCVFFHYQEDQA